ncbi:hypothetical protein ACH5RR_006485 [Cinchona calisaya]|uniref:Gnk2-homologous domain-containing protein n=1 Tax=Cinchona calisaya TaxID=153742 RepID=A0ABD3AP46_9GENT
MAFLPKINASAVVITTLLVVGLCGRVVTSTSNTTLGLYLCNTLTYQNSDPYRLSVDYILNDLLTVTANTQGYNHYVASPCANNIPKAYGHETCNVLLSATDCATCILAAYNNIRNLCPDRIGAQVHLQDCSMRYENYPFAE